MKYKVGAIVNGMHGRIEIQGKNIFGEYFGVYTEIFAARGPLRVGMATGPMTQLHLDQFNKHIPCPMEVNNEIQRR